MPSSFLSLTLWLSLYIILQCSLATWCQNTPYKDVPFWQETHEAFPHQDEVRRIAIDPNFTAWIATSSGIYYKKPTNTKWEIAWKGSAFDIATTADGTVWFGAWNGVYTIKEGKANQIPGVEAPISQLCSASEGVYAAGPNGIWLWQNNQFSKKNFDVPRSIRSLKSDTQGGLLTASDVGLYHVDNQGKTSILAKPNVVMSAYIKGIAIDTQHHWWIGGLGGVSIVKDFKKINSITTAQGLPTIYVNCLETALDGTIWVGTELGVVRYYKNGTHSLRFSKRWLLHDQVNDIAFDTDGNAWIATPKGVSVIKKQQITLAQKNDYFQKVLLERHIRTPWIAGQCRLEKAGDLTTWRPEDDDNDGEYTGNYLAMESFRYATTKDPDAKQNAKKAFEFLKLLQTVTGTDGFFARTIVPADWKYDLHDENKTYTPQELTEELVKEPRFKAVETRWRKSTDGKWLWKGDTSSDEMCGHIFGYYFYYELIADDTEKQVVRTHVKRIIDYLIKHDFNFIDIDGKHTRWSVWSPKKLNHDPEWVPDKAQNSMEMLAFLKLAHYMTNEEKYQQHYLRLINEEHYLENMAKIPQQNPAWFIYFDVMLQAYVYPILLKCEKDPQRLAFYQKHIDAWFERRRNDHNPLINFIYCYARNRQTELANSIDFLKDTPLDLIDWHIDHSQREDLKIVRTPILEDKQVNILQPPSMRMTVRWDKNPWAATGGDPHREREPVFWQLPYWMGRYLGMIK